MNNFRTSPFKVLRDGLISRIILQLDQLSPQGSLLYKSYLEQAKAYLDYRRGDFNSVRNRTGDALEMDLVLEEEFGFYDMLLHRIQLVHNLVRTEARNNRIDLAIELACQILSYLKGASEVLPIPGLWGGFLIIQMLPDLISPRLHSDRPYSY